MIPCGSTVSQTPVTASAPRRDLDAGMDFGWQLAHRVCGSPRGRALRSADDFDWAVARTEPVATRRRTMRRTTVVLGALMACLLVGLVGQGLADDLCFSGVTNQQFHLEVTGTTTTSVGTVMSLVGIDHLSGNPDLKSPVTGTLYVDSSGFRVSLLDMNGLGLGPNLLWNAHLTATAVNGGTIFRGSFTVNPQPSSATLTGTMTLIDC